MEQMLMEFEAWWAQAFEEWLDRVHEVSRENDPQKVKEVIIRGPCGCDEFVAALGDGFSLPPGERHEFARRLYHISKRWISRVQSAAELYAAGVIAWEKQQDARRLAPAVPVGMKN